jgi:sensor histidine kinase YesM
MQLNHQIQPHFLFNALNSIYGLIRLKKYESLTKSFEHLVLYIRSKYQEKDFLYPLEKEISHTTHFLVIQKLRFGERLRIDWEIDSEIQQALVIPYLLQSLAENAFKHGIEMIEEEAIIEISIKKHTERQIQLRVKDNGPGFLKDPLSSVQNGVGLINIKRRLDLLFAEEAQISFEFGEGGCVIVKWPLIFDMEVYGYERSTVR